MSHAVDPSITNPSRQVLRQFLRVQTKRDKKVQTHQFSRPNPLGNRHKRRRDYVVQPKMLAIGLKALFG